MKPLRRRHFLGSLLSLQLFSTVSSGEKGVSRSREGRTLIDANRVEPPAGNVVDSGPFEATQPSSDLGAASILTENGLQMFDPEARGWELQSDATIAQLLSGLHADSYLFAGRQELVGTGTSTRNKLHALVSHRAGLPYGGMVLFEISPSDRPWFEANSEDGRWSSLGDGFVEDPNELSQERFNGEKHWYPGQEGESGLLSVFAEPSLDYMVADSLAHLERGFGTLFVDHASISTLNGLDFSRWAVEAFCDHLTEFSRDRLDGLGIDDPQSFDIREYVEREGLAPGDVDTPFEDEVLREFKLFHHAGIRRYWRELAAALRSSAVSEARGSINLYGNQYMDEYFSHTPISSFTIDEPFDVVSIEDQLTVPPTSIRDSVYKLGHSIGKYDKPVVVWGRIHEDTHELDTTLYRPSLLRLQFGEGYANGGVLPISLTGGGDNRDGVANNWVDEEITIDDSLQSIVDFVWAHEPYLVESQPDHRVAVIYSLPTLMWSVEPDWIDDEVNPHSQSFSGATRRLTRNQIPYDVLTFGFPGLFTDPDQLERLSTYDLVILPAVECISDDQFEAVRNAVDDGTQILVSGSAPDRTERYRTRDDVRRFVEDEERCHRYGDDPARTEGFDDDADPPTEYDAYRDSVDDKPFIDPVESLHERQIDVDESALGVTVQAQSDDSRVLVHLVNYEYDRNADDVATKTDVDLTISGVDIDPEVARWYSDTEIENLEQESTEDGALRLQIPAVEEWGFVVLAAGESALLGEGDEAAATAAIDSLKEKIEHATSEGLIGTVPAEATADRAEVALEYGRYDLAVEEAERAESTLEDAYDTPVIGIDQAQGSSSVSLERFREVYDEYQYEDITDWAADQLEATDLFVIPAGGEIEFVEFSLSSADLESLESYVSDGGRVVLLGRAGMGPGMNRIMRQFGMEFGEAAIKTNDGDEYAFYVDTAVSSLTPFLPKWRARLGVPIAETGEADVIGWVTDDREPWLEGEETSAAGLPMMAACRVGSGAVLAIGEPAQFSGAVPIRDVKGQGVIENVVPGLVRPGLLERLQEFADESTSDPDDDGTDDSPDEREPDTETTVRESTDDAESSPDDSQAVSVPGFGMVQTVGGVIAGAEVLRRRRNRSDD
ncbi:MAG: hypothetical protein ACOCSF_03280 [Halanaeroarchaeum sp.]